MDFQKLLSKAKSENHELTKDEALFILEKSWFSISRTLDLLKTASIIRKRFVGDEVRLCIYGGPIKCLSLNSTCKDIAHTHRGALNISEFLSALCYLDEWLDYVPHNLFIEGGFEISDCEDNVINYIEGLSRITHERGFTISLGNPPYMEIQGFLRLRRLGVSEVAIPLETTNRKLFYKVRPNDYFEKRYDQARIVCRAGLKYLGGVAVGIHKLLDNAWSFETMFRDYVTHIMMLRDLECTSCIHVHPCEFVLDVKLAEQTSDADVARVGALVRIVCRDKEVDVSCRDFNLSMLAGRNRVTFEYVAIGRGFHDLGLWMGSKIRERYGLLILDNSKRVLESLKTFNLRIKE